MNAFDVQQITQAVEDADGVYVNGSNGSEKYISVSLLLALLAKMLKEDR